MQIKVFVITNNIRNGRINMSDTRLEDLVVLLAEKDDAASLEKLLEKLTGVDLTEGEFPGHIDFLLESWGENLTQSRATFCLSLAELETKDDPGFRNILGDAIKLLLPPFLNKTGFIRALGIRDNNVPLPEIVRRFHNLPKLRIGLVVFLPNSTRWGTVHTIDGVTGTIGINALSGNGSYALPLSILLSEVIMFEAATDIARLAGFPPKCGFTSNEYRELANHRAVLPLKVDEIKKIAKASLVPASLNINEFEGWWSNTGVASVANGKRRSCDSRSLKELHLLLKEENSDKPFSVEDIAAFATFFERLKEDAAQRERILLAESIAMISGRCQPVSVLSRIIAPLKGKVKFFPVNVYRVNLDDFDIWGDVPVKLIDTLALAAKSIYTPEELACYALRLPLRGLNVFCQAVEDHLLTESIKATRCPSCDILLWLWKNRKGHSDELLQELNFNNVINALSIDNLPKAWLANQRELKKILMDKPDFQQFLLDNDSDDYSELTALMHGSIIFAAGEQQSLLVKLSRLSSGLRQHLEDGAGEKLMAQTKAANEANAHHGPLFTSPRSHQRMHHELEDIINVQMPENRESLKIARAHGDLRENAEYDAAKERRNFLSRRRVELDRDLTNTQSIDFQSIKPEDIVIMGSSVTIQHQNGNEETIHIVGSWDGNPEKNMISYRAALGASMLDHHVGDTIKLPDGKNVVIKSISSLPRAVLELLSE